MSDALRYLLDTNIILSLAKLPQGPVLKHLKRAGEGSVCTSIVVACELRFGLAQNGSSTLVTQVGAILAPLPVLLLEAPVDEHYGNIRVALEREGTPIGSNDLLIAAHASTLGLILVTDNLREFRRVAGLAVENWLMADG